MRTYEELSEAEVALRRLIYAIERKDEHHPAHPIPLGEEYLQFVLTEVKEIAMKLEIPLVKNQ